MTTINLNTSSIQQINHCLIQSDSNEYSGSRFWNYTTFI